MATKKQKHAEALARREAFIAEEKARGLTMLRKAREKQKREELQAWQDQHDKKHSWKKRIKECPHCALEMKKADEAIVDYTAKDLTLVDELFGTSPKTLQFSSLPSI